MCGFITVINRDGLSLDNSKYKRALKYLLHRGPDFQDVFFNTKNTLFQGHTRLSILDLSSAGNQPFRDIANNFSLVFNGQIYNHNKIRDKFSNKDYNYISKCDTETLFVELIKNKEKTFNSLTGMWSFVFWDEINSEIIASRDRFGIKPLFFYKSSKGDLCFASEIKAIINLYPETKKHNVRVMQQYIARGWLDHTSETFFSEIKQIPPGCFIKNQNSNIKIQRYWDLPEPNNEALDFKVLENCFVNTISEGIQSDVPIATTLSGGIDSGSINCTLSKKLKLWNELHAFSVQPKDTPDESQWINDSVEYNQIKHNYLNIDQFNAIESIDQLLIQMDEPFFNVSTIYQNRLRKYISSFKYKVLLVGDGADELFSGYSKLLPIYMQSLINAGKTDLVENTFKYGLELTGLSKSKLLERIKLFNDKGYGGRFLQEYRRGYEIISRDRDPKVDKDLFPLIEHNHIKPSQDGFLIYKELSDRIKIDIPHHLRNEDRNSMAYGIESRPLFLDHNLLENIWSFPFELLMLHGLNKFLLRKIMSKTVNKSVLDLRRKFVRPGNNSSFAYGELSNKIKEYIMDDKFKIISNCSKSRLFAMYEEDYERNCCNNAYPWFRAYSYIRWYEIFC
tara:strand:+ start:1899 stop:3761 length:1863 start_codon:yes stop_codon:yes gene_type:complete